MSNSTSTFGQELLGRNHVTSTDIIVGSSIALFAGLQLVCGSVNLWILSKVKIFQNAFGTISASRTTVDMLSSLLHISYSSYVTLSQRSDYPSYLAIAAGNLGYVFATISCGLHVLLAMNRFTSVYFPMKYALVFSRRNCVRIIAALVVGLSSFVLLSYNLVPCNVIGYGAAHYGYIMLSCSDPNHERPFHFGRLVNWLCGTFFCFGAIVMDAATIRKLYVLKNSHGITNQNNFDVKVRFTKQSFSQNIPMFIEIIFLTLGDNSPDDSKALERTVSFILTRFTDLINTTTIIIFNPEARSFLFKRMNRVTAGSSMAGNHPEVANY
ncbi:hypothetical protein QR680_016389 [Steinernema hermaphroditum]|uniref:7TM GPCR serpentine receptor class x (Srx) domain-containing protein n=1 Tax=Steinernema hermaphroditum TaxID=289476 RepID=A0AA39HB22_9BILA|nr:hypothetical protein QR680_016389 [Steinernema hermaphroditum]